MNPVVGSKPGRKAWGRTSWPVEEADTGIWSDSEFLDSLPRLRLHILVVRKDTAQGSTWVRVIPDFDRRKEKLKMCREREGGMGDGEGDAR